MKEFLHHDTETHLFCYLGRNQYTFKTSKIIFTITKKLTHVTLGYLYCK